MFNSIVNRTLANQGRDRTPRGQAGAEPGVSKMTGIKILAKVKLGISIKAFYKEAGYGGACQEESSHSWEAEEEKLTRPGIIIIII